MVEDMENGDWKRGLAPSCKTQENASAVRKLWVQPTAQCSVCVLRMPYGVFSRALVAGMAAMDHDGCQNASGSVHVNQASGTPCYFVNRAVG